MITNFKKLFTYSQSHQTPELPSTHSNQVYTEINSKYPLSKRNSQMSVMEKLKSSKHQNINDIDISHKLKLPQSMHDSKSKYFVLSQINKIIEPQDIKLKGNNQPYKYKENQQNCITFSPLQLKDRKKNQNPVIFKYSKQQKQNLARTPSRQTFFNPTQSWNNKITPQKSVKKLEHAKLSNIRHPLTQISIHQQLYLQSRKKQIKRSAQQIIQNEYFKKIHSFKPQVSEVSEFLAEVRRQKNKQKQKFEKQFQQFDDWRQQRKSNISPFKIQKRKTKDLLDIQKEKESLKKQAELKNYTILKQFFYYLTQGDTFLSKSDLSPQILCELPAPCINMLEPIIEDFYKNKKTKRLQWLQFLSQFNLKIEKRKSFYGLIEKWFFIKYGIQFDSHGRQSYQNTNEQSCEYKKKQDSTYIGQSIIYQADSMGKSKKNKINSKQL